MKVWLKTGIVGLIYGAILATIIFFSGLAVRHYTIPIIKIIEVFLIFIASGTLIGIILGYLCSKTKQTQNKIIKIILLTAIIIILISVISITLFLGFMSNVKLEM